MRTPRQTSDYLLDIAGYAEKARKLTDGMDLQTFLGDEKTQLAAVRCLEVIGEAAGLRDVLIHDYFGVNLEVVWNTVQQDLPPLRTALLPLLKP